MVLVINQDQIAVLPGIELATGDDGGGAGGPVEGTRGAGRTLPCVVVVLLPRVYGVDDAGLVDVVVSVVGVIGEATHPIVLGVRELVLWFLSDIWRAAGCNYNRS